MNLDYDQMKIRRHRRGWIGAAAFAAVSSVSIGGLALAGAAPTPTADTSIANAEVFVGMSPTRVLDTRQDGGSRFGEFETRTVNLSSMVPADASSVVINTTLDASAGPTYLTIWPTGTTRPTASVNNGLEGVTMPNSMIAKLGTGRSLDVYNERNTSHVIIDIVGYFVPLDTVTGLGSGGMAATGPVGPAGPAGPAGARGLDGDDGSGAGVATVNADLLGMPIAVLDVADTFVDVATFSAPVDGNYMLDASIDARFDPPASIGIGVGADVICRWDDGNNIERGASITADNVVGLITVPGLGYANIGVPGIGSTMTAGDTIDLQCKTDVLLAVGSQPTVTAAFTAIQVTTIT
jgi:hypothetical protein